MTHAKVRQPCRPFVNIPPVIRDGQVQVKLEPMRNVSGDSGGPLILPDAPARSISRGQPGLDTVVALTSFGVDPCLKGATGGYTLEGPFRDCIDTVLASIGESEPPVRTSSQLHHWLGSCQQH